MNLNYGLDVLVPVARQFKGGRDKVNEKFKLTSRGVNHRVEFINKKLEKDWVEFCVSHGLNNDTSLKY